MASLKVAIIGGTGVYTQDLLEQEKEILVETRYGSVTMTEGIYQGRTVYFMARHGGGHSVPPHLVNYLANIAALKHLNVAAVISTAAVGTLNEKMPPGSRIVIDQFIDLTKNRPLTFYEGQGGTVVHTDFTAPYCSETRAAILRAGQSIQEQPLDGGCYVCAEGPRFETPAEIKMMKLLGGDLVGMTNVPEVVLAREAGLCYANISLATNFAAGLAGTPLSHEEVLEEMERGKSDLQKLLVLSVMEIKADKSCSCADAGKYWNKELHG